MSKYYHALSKKYSFLETWYFKHIQGSKSIALVPGIHFDHSGHRFAFIEIITNDCSYYVPYPFSSFNASKNSLDIQVDVNHFSSKGIKIFIDTPNLCLKGAIHYEPFKSVSAGNLSAFYLRPFIPFHSAVISMLHNITGYLILNNKTYDFNEGKGYIETDWGHYLPKTYLWTQCNAFNTEQNCSITATVFPAMLFNRLIINTACSIQYQNHIYTLATHLGAKIIEYSSSSLTIQQGSYSLSVRVTANPSSCFSPLLKGDMTRIIHSCSNCSVCYHFKINNLTLFELASNNANFEFFS